jgi:spermidine synthase
MKVELEDVLFWMDAIRNSDDSHRTLESFWKGQVRSKAWLVETLYICNHIDTPRIIIHGGWNGVLASILFNSEIHPSHITSVDIDPACRDIASTVNKRQEIEGRFEAVTCDMTEYEYTGQFDIVINTSVEHITPTEYSRWFDRVPQEAMVVLQSNNYFDLDEHVNCSPSLNEFKRESHLAPMFSGIFNTEKYDRYMIIGKK